MSGSPILAGRLNRRLILESPNPTRGVDGALIEGWTTVATVWGAIEPVGGREVVETGRYATEISHRLRIRFRTDIKSTWRVSLSDTATSPATTRLFRIIVVLNPGDGRRELHIMAKELPDGDTA